MFGVALIIRLAVAGFLYPELLDPRRDYWHFGWETGRIAHSIAAGHGFAAPVYGFEGPTAWMGPVYPFLLAGVFKVFGIFSKASALAILALNSVFSAATCIPIFFFASHSFGERVGRWVGWTWALYPYAIYFAAGRVWDVSLSTLLFCIVFLLTLRLEGETRPGYWLLYGALCGFTALTNPATMGVLPFLGAWLGLRLCQRGDRAWKSFPQFAALSATAFVLVLSPWVIRNYGTFGRFIPVRDNFWLEVYAGNTGDTSDLYPDWAHPSTNPAEMERLRSLGETAYMDEKRAQALDWLRRYPGAFMGMTLRRFAYTWSGYWSFRGDYLGGEPFAIPNIFFCSAVTLLMLNGVRQARRNLPGALAPYALSLLIFPAVYYVTHPSVDYRQPIDPEIVTLAVYGVASRRGRG